jgi:ribonuclease HII
MGVILGIDEVGRGPWAGPLVIGAVVLGDTQIKGLTDSKKLTVKKREELAKQIRGYSSGFSLGWVSAAELDELGLIPALHLATQRAVEQINIPFNEIIIDGTNNFLSGTKLEKYVTTLKKADTLIPEVSAASIIAKVARDDYMKQLATKYPHHGFENHVGYGTAAHLTAIKSHGLTPEHRFSFAPIADLLSSFLRTSPPAKTATYIPDGTERFAHSAILSDAQLMTCQAESGVRKKETQKSTKHTTQVGNTAELKVIKHLESEGHKIITHNWKTKFCEIDIVSEKSNTLYFTEVKYRKTSTHGDGLTAITPTKLKQMRFAADAFIAMHPEYNYHQPLLQAASVSGSDFYVEEITTL